MPKILKDWTGTKIGKLIVIRESKPRVGFNGRKVRIMYCKCDCGISRDFTLGNITKKQNPTQSCGCLNSINKQTHNLSNNPLYKTYTDMLRRCNNKKSKDYKNYGARGIKVCKRWSLENGKGLINFIEDMGPKIEGTTLDRINSNKGYSKANCRWADKFIQANNKNSNTLIKYNNTQMSFTELWRLKGEIVCFNTAIARYTKLGWSAIRSVTTPARNRMMSK